jgi:hypothetical protein
VWVVLPIAVLLWLLSRRGFKPVECPPFKVIEQNNHLDEVLASAPLPLVLRVSLLGTVQPVCPSDGTIISGYCKNDGGIRLNPPLPACVHEVSSKDVIFGLWHSLATEDRLPPLLDTWGKDARIVLLGSEAGVQGTERYRMNQVLGSNPLLLNTGMVEDDYFSTLGKAFIGLRMMVEMFPDASWFVIAGDDNYVNMPEFLKLLSAFDPSEKLALTRMVHRRDVGCKVAGGAGIITSRAMTKALAPELESFFQEMYDRAKGDVKRLPQEDKFHDMAFQRMVEERGWQFVHLDSLMHEPPGFYFHPQKGSRQSLLSQKTPSLFHFVPGDYLRHLSKLVKTKRCLPPTGLASSVALGIFGGSRSVTNLDEQRIRNTWGEGGKIPYRILHEEGHLDQLQKMLASFPSARWIFLVHADSYPLISNAMMRIEKLQREGAGGARGAALVLQGPLPGESWPRAKEDVILISRPLAGLITGHRGLSNANLVDTVGLKEPDALLLDEGLSLCPDHLEACVPAAIGTISSYTGLRPEFVFSEYSARLSVAHWLLESSNPIMCQAVLKGPSK